MPFNLVEAIDIDADQILPMLLSELGCSMQRLVVMYAKILISEPVYDILTPRQLLLLTLIVQKRF